MANTAQDVLNSERADIGYSRWDDPNPGTTYGRWYAGITGSSYYGQSGVPYCAMFQSYHFNKVGAKCPGLPGAYCPTMAQAGKNAGRQVDKYSAQPGDLVYFDWTNDGEIDHIGICELNMGSYLQTIEGNTGNGQVLRRTRSFGTISCVIRPPYDGSPAPSPSPDPAPSDVSTLVKAGQAYLAKFGYDLGGSGIDGVYGPATRAASIRYAQYNMNAYGAGIAVDGLRGPATNAAWTRLGPVYLGVKNRTYMVKAVQIALLLHGYSIGTAGIDGSFGNDTDTAVKKYQNRHGLEVDGYVGPATFASLF